jgi:tricorn protease
MRLSRLFPALLCSLVLTAAVAQTPHILQSPALSAKLIAFGYAGDLWTVPREGGRATRLTTGVGIEALPVFSPDGNTIAFSGQYDGNTDVFTIPATGGIPHRVTYHPAGDFAVGWTPDGKSILFRSNRAAYSRYTQLFTVPAAGGQATVLPLPMAYSGSYSPDAKSIAYTPLPQAFGFDYTSYVSWGNYRGGRAGTVWITTLPGLESVEVPHEVSSDFSPVFAGGKVYFLSGRHKDGNSGHIGIFCYDPATRAVTEVFHNTGTDLHSLATDGKTLIFDQLGELYLLDPAEGKPHAVSIDVTGDLPEVRAHLKKVGDEVQNFSLSPSGLRVAFEAHGEILTVPAKHGPVRNLTNSPGSMERAPAWAPDGQSVAFFSDATAGGKPGLYSLHIESQTGGSAPRVIALAPEPEYYFSPVWSPDSKHISFQDEHGQQYLVDVDTARFTRVTDGGVFGGFSSQESAVAWSPDSKWLVYPKSMPNHLHALYLYELATGAATQLTSDMADASSPAFDRNGKYLYFIASNNDGATSDGLDMTSDLYTVTRSIYALSLFKTTASPIAPESDDEKSAAEVKEKARDDTDKTPAGEEDKAKEEAKKHPDEPTDKSSSKPDKPAEPTKIDLAGLSVEAIAARIIALPLPPRGYESLSTGKPGTLYFLESPFQQNEGGQGGAPTLNRWVLEGRKTEKLADHVAGYEVSADGEKMLVAITGGEGGMPHFFIQPANAPIKPGDGAVSTDGLEVRVDPAAEWRQMYHEVWRIERAYFYDAHFHGVDTVALEKKLAPYADAIASRADLNYIFQEMLSAFSVGHLRGYGGAIPAAAKVPGGLLGADYVIDNDRYCFSKIYTGGSWSPDVKAPLAQPGLNIHTGLCILAIDGQPLTAATDIQQALEGTAGHAITLKLGGPHSTLKAGEDGARDVTVVPVPNEYSLRNTDWIDANQKKVDALSGGKIAYVYLPDTGAGGFSNFNRYYFAQLNKQGAIIDERFNAGGQIADYIIEVLGRHIESYWSPRFGAIEHTPNAGIYGPKVMIANEFSGSGGDALPWLFKQNKLGPLVGKRTWGGLVGIGNIPVLMDGGEVTSPSVAFFSPKGEWDVENHGVDPDVAVEQDPKAVAEGHDPQLEKAVALALEELKQHPVPQPVRPPYPVYTY